MTSKERYRAILSGGIPDRPAIKLWGASPDQELIHPAYQPVHEIAMQKTDLFVSAGSAFNLYWGANQPETEVEEQDAGSPDWVDVVTTTHSPMGPLRSIFRRSTTGQPGYEIEHPIKEPADLDRLMSFNYEPYPFDASQYFKTEEGLGDRGITGFALDHGPYGLQRQMGSENLGLWSLDADLRARLLEIIDVLSGRVLAHVEAAIAAGIKGMFMWVGPELFIPPLMSPTDFDEFDAPFDKRTCDVIHEVGGHVWVHSHGKMKQMLSRFADIGVDLLNPIEPPPMGDVSLAEAFETVGDRMGLEGTIQTHDLMTASEERIRELVCESMAVGQGKRFVLCPTSGYMEFPEPPEPLIRNTIAYVDEAWRATH